MFRGSINVIHEKTKKSLDHTYFKNQKMKSYFVSLYTRMQLIKPLYDNFNALGAESKGFQFKDHRSLGKT